MSFDYLGFGHAGDGGDIVDRYHHPLPHPATSTRATQDVSTLPVAKAPEPGAASTSGSSGNGGASSPAQQNGWPTDSNGNPLPITALQWNELQTAIHQAFSGISGGETAGHINQAILSFLQSTGHWTAYELGIVSQSLPGQANPNFREQANPQGVKGGDGGAALMTDWFNHISAGLNAAMASVPPPAPSAGSGSTGPDQGFLQQLLGAALGGGSSSGGSGGGGLSAPEPSAPTMVPVQQSPSLILPLILLGGGGALAFYWYKHRHGGGSEE